MKMQVDSEEIRAGKVSRKESAAGGRGAKRRVSSPSAGPVPVRVRPAGRARRLQRVHGQLSPL